MHEQVEVRKKVQKEARAAQRVPLRVADANEVRVKSGPSGPRKQPYKRGGL